MAKEVCPTCDGKGVLVDDNAAEDEEGLVKCQLCQGDGWIETTTWEPVDDD